MDSNQAASAEIELSDDGDASLIRWMLSLTPEARLAVLQGFVDSAVEFGNSLPSISMSCMPAARTIWTAWPLR
jgi:hypothetical protein